VNCLRVDVDSEITDLDDGLRMASGAAHDGLDPSDQFSLVKRLGQIVVGTEAKTFDLVVYAGETGEDQNWCVTLESLKDRRTSKPDMSGRFRSSRMMS
jgi:hypothetical protein